MNAAHLQHSDVLHLRQRGVPRSSSRTWRSGEVWPHCVFLFFLFSTARILRATGNDLIHHKCLEKQRPLAARDV